MATERDRFRARLKAIRADAPARQRQAERWVRDYYRAHRKLPKGAAAWIIPRRRLYRLICVGEIEHALGLAPALVRLSTVWRRVVATLSRPRG